VPLYRSLQFDARRDFTPVSHVCGAQKFAAAMSDQR
jgi:hypothetical protein